MNASKESEIIKIWEITLAGAVLWWFLGFNLFIYHFSAAVLFFYVVSRLRSQRINVSIPPSAVLIFMIALVYLFSILIHSMDGDASRIVAALYNFSFWIMGGLLVVALSNVFHEALTPRVFRAISIVAWTTGILALLVLSAWKQGVDGIVFKTPLYGLTRFMGQTTLVESSLLVRPLLFDWFASLTRPRFNVFSPYPTAAGGIIMILIMMLVTKGSEQRKLVSPKLIFLMGLNCLALVMTLSRMSVFSLGAALMAVYVMQKKNFVIWLILLFFILLAAEPLIEDLFHFFLGLREGSNSSRIELYRYSLMQLEGIDWVIGQGLKPRESQFIYPLGSHSTYISLLFKTGSFGAGLFILFQAVVIARWFLFKKLASEKRQVFCLWRGTGFVFIGMAMWMVTEDIDAPQLLAFLYFSFIGIFEGLRKERMNEALSKSIPEAERIPFSGAYSS